MIMNFCRLEDATRPVQRNLDLQPHKKRYLEAQAATQKETLVMLNVVPKLFISAASR